MEFHGLFDAGGHGFEVGVLESPAYIEVLQMMAVVAGLVEDGFCSLHGFDKGLVIGCPGACSLVSDVTRNSGGRNETYQHES